MTKLYTVYATWSRTPFFTSRDGVASPRVMQNEGSPSSPQYKSDVSRCGQNNLTTLSKPQKNID